MRLIEARAAKLGLQITTVQGEFLSAGMRGESYDAVLFYECFHHCDDHLRLLAHMDRVVGPGGKLVLAGETVNESIPYDWGLNPNGEALWQIISNGWFELAFRESYLLRTLRKHGWRANRQRSDSDMLIYVCERNGR